MVKAEYIFKDTETGMEYIHGKGKVIFENGVVLTLDELAANRGNIGNIIREKRLDPACCDFDYAYAKTTGLIRHKPTHKSTPKPDSVVVPAVPEVKKAEVKTPVNWFDWLYPKLMLIIPVICSVLSVYFTGVYMQELQPPVIAYFVSVSLLLYGLVGSQMSRRAFHKKRFLKGLLFGVTSACAIGFSMYTALDVNYKKYIANHEDVVRTEEIHENNTLEYELLKDELASNKEQIDVLSKTYVVMWDGEKKTNVVVEGKVTEKAQNQINVLNERNTVINTRLIELARSSVSVERTDTDKAKTIGDLIGAILGISGNIVQMLILLLPSIFIDLVNVLSLTIYNDRYSQEEDNE